jgi:hypothetical protein
VSEPQALSRLIALPGRLDVRVYSHPSQGFHPKAYLFEHDDRAGRAFVGSANLSRSGLAGGVEWTWTIEATDLGHPMDELLSQFALLFTDSPHAVPLSPAWIDAYALRRAQRPLVPLAAPGAPSGAQRLLVRPSDAQAAPTEPAAPRPRRWWRWRRSPGCARRASGARWSVAATGIGKTWLAAFDARGFDRVLFIAHREELLLQAREAFAQVFPDRTTGLRWPAAPRAWTANWPSHRSRRSRARARSTIRGWQASTMWWLTSSITRPPQLSAGAAAPVAALPAGAHGHALPRRQPRPARAVRWQRRLRTAAVRGDLAGWLAPFRDLGVADPVDYDASLLNASRTGYDIVRLLSRYVDARRTDLVLRLYREHAGRAALGFCVSIEHAEAMAAAFREAGVPALAVHSGTARDARGDAIEALARGALKILFTVDLFNEGVDIPFLDLAMFLRPTESMTVFLQQLGRGLRLHPGKARLTVVDLIGNHRKAQFKLPFLIGLEDDDPAAAAQGAPEGDRPDARCAARDAARGRRGPSRGAGAGAPGDRAAPGHGPQAPAEGGLRRGLSARWAGARRWPSSRSAVALDLGLPARPWQLARDAGGDGATRRRGARAGAVLRRVPARGREDRARPSRTSW